jgi:hypothetical protein
MKKNLTQKKNLKLFFIISGIVVFLVVVYVGMPQFLGATYEAKVVKDITDQKSPAQTVSSTTVSHISTPDPVKGIYMTACVAATPVWRERLENMIKTTELNSVVIDIKDYSGTISFIDPSLQGNDVTGCRAKDMSAFISELHRANIYVIGRITVFQDPYYASRHPELAVKSKSTGGIWKDKNGLPFIDVGAKPYWDYIISIAKASYALGFDEINFDYIRYPSDGNMADARYSWTIGSSTKAEMVKNFFEYLHNGLKNSGMKISADLFGLVTVAEDDLGIGQVLTNALPYFDYVDPMVYPSHFAPGADGYKVPAAHPYDIVHYSMATGLKREEALNIENGIATSTPSKLRPWLQDFDLLGIPYGVPEVQAQIKATYDVGLSSWLLWDAGNKYTPEALKPK